MAVLCGARQVGKTRLLRHALPGWALVSLEDPDMREFAISDPRGFLARHRAPLVIDEAQRVPALLSYLQTMVDADGRPGQYVLSGSQQFSLLAGVTQSLAGPATLIEMRPLRLKELADAQHLPASSALTTGCSIIVKAPEETPASPAALMKALADAGVPAGVIGLVYGDPAEISGYLIPHPVICKITFTGSTPVGKQLAAMAGLHMKRATMELGGHGPVIVAEDADIAQAVKAAGAAKFRNAEQVCISPTRFLVHNSIRAEFERALVAQAGKLKVGDGLAEGTTTGPLANPRRLAAMQKITADAVQRGAKLALGGERIGSTGNFFAPTVLTEVPLDAMVFNQEPFGPLAAVRGFDTLDEAITESNRLPFGLASYAYTKSLATAHALSQRLEVGMLWVNQPALALPEMPFGGVKDSGYGSEGGPEALEAYLVAKSVSILMG